MGNVKDKKRHQTTLNSIVTRAVFGIGFGILALAICADSFLDIATDKHIFTSETLPAIRVAFLVGYLCISLYLIFVIPFFSIRNYKKRGQSILEVTDKIRNQDLDFDISFSGVKEIDQILESINDMKQALKEALEKQWRLEQNRKGQISALAHDFKTPVTILRGNIDLLLRSKLDENCKGYAEDARASLEQIEMYQAQLLEIMHAERGYVLNRCKIELGKLLNEVVLTFTRIADKKNSTIFVEKSEEDVFVSADRVLFERVLNNLILNALDFTPRNGIIRLALITEKSKAVVSIADSGCGFSQNALKHGVEQFYMDDTSRGRKNHYGLGLFIADSIIKQHNGTMQLSNDVLTGGAKITIQLPLIKE